MKRSLIYVLLTSTIGLAQANSSIPYQNVNTIQNGQPNSTVNAAPVNPPTGMPAAYNNEYNSQQYNNYNGQVGNTDSQQMQQPVETVNEQGQKVIRTTEYQPLPATEIRQGQPNGASGATLTEKFWNTSNQQIRNIRQKYESRGAAINQAISPAKCVQSTVSITNEPGANLPVIRLDGRNIATVLVTDVLGKPWSIDYISNSSDINIVRDTDNPEVSSFHVQTKNNYAQGNFAVKLKDNPVPIVFSFVTAQKEADCLMVAKLDKASPNTNIQTETLSTSAMSSELNSTLYGVAPNGSKRLKTSSNAATAWLLDDGKVVIRTKYQLLAPAFESVSRSPDGTHVYKTQYSPIYTYRYNDVIGDFKVSK